MFDGFCCLLNADIYFDDTLYNLKKANKKCVFAQLRFENNFIIKYISGMQDSWLFHSKYVNELVDKKCDFQLGIPSCDHVILYIFYQFGFELINDPHFIKTHHCHNSNIRNYSKSDKIIGPYLFLNPILPNIPIPHVVKPDNRIKMKFLNPILPNIPIPNVVKPDNSIKMKFLKHHNTLHLL